MNRAARSIRSGSSEKDTSGARGVRSTPSTRVGHAAERIDQLHVGQPQRHGVHREVARGQVVLDVLGVDDVRLARVLAVRLGEWVVTSNVTRPLRPDGAERPALRPRRVGPTLEQRQRLLRPGVGGEIEIGTVVHAIQDHVAHDPPTR